MLHSLITSFVIESGTVAEAPTRGLLELINYDGLFLYHLLRHLGADVTALHGKLNHRACTRPQILQNHEQTINYVLSLGISPTLVPTPKVLYTATKESVAASLIYQVIRGALQRRVVLAGPWMTRVAAYLNARYDLRAEPVHPPQRYPEASKLPQDVVQLSLGSTCVSYSLFVAAVHHYLCSTDVECAGFFRSFYKYPKELHQMARNHEKLHYLFRTLKVPFFFSNLSWLSLQNSEAYFQLRIIQVYLVLEKLRGHFPENGIKGVSIRSSSPFAPSQEESKLSLPQPLDDIIWKDDLDSQDQTPIDDSALYRSSETVIFQAHDTSSLDFPPHPSEHSRRSTGSSHTASGQPTARSRGPAGSDYIFEVDAGEEVFDVAYATPEPIPSTNSVSGDAEDVAATVIITRLPTTELVSESSAEPETVVDKDNGVRRVQSILPHLATRVEGVTGRLSHDGSTPYPCSMSPREHRLSDACVRESLFGHKHALVQDEETSETNVEQIKQRYGIKFLPESKDGQLHQQAPAPNSEQPSIAESIPPAVQTDDCQESSVEPDEAAVREPSAPLCLDDIRTDQGDANFRLSRAEQQLSSPGKRQSSVEMMEIVQLTLLHPNAPSVTSSRSDHTRSPSSLARSLGAALHTHSRQYVAHLPPSVRDLIANRKLVALGALSDALWLGGETHGDVCNTFLSPNGRLYRLVGEELLHVSIANNLPEAPPIVPTDGEDIVVRYGAGWEEPDPMIHLSDRLAPEIEVGPLSVTAITDDPIVVHAPSPNTDRVATAHGTRKPGSRESYRLTPDGSGLSASSNPSRPSSSSIIARASQGQEGDRPLPSTDGKGGSQPPAGVQSHTDIQDATQGSTLTIPASLLRKLSTPRRDVRPSTLRSPQGSRLLGTYNTLSPPPADRPLSGTAEGYPAVIDGIPCLRMSGTSATTTTSIGHTRRFVYRGRCINRFARVAEDKPVLVSLRNNESGFYIGFYLKPYLLARIEIADITRVRVELHRVFIHCNRIYTATGDTDTVVELELQRKEQASAFVADLEGARQSITE
ncbi:hypothetical protein GMRT_12666 [Giardia muris]|uniref:Uncharacterized protein n=1 Tax=Giardia muris TaxID=5742 RepID=A0A4Z1SWE7_GIAMU|nr:hypothetical protein GMRT_12666 [Giardia muris]|eukprot:TNJ27858.1 hypothetical protein GMRT_12666 [Giardia muris]